MNDKFKSTLLWTIYITIVLVGLFTLISLGVNVLAPTFFPNTNISGFKEYINIFCVFLSFLSVGLGIYSVWQANGSNRQANEILKSIKTIESEQRLAQDLMLVITKATNNGKNIKTSNANQENDWEPDNDIT